MVHRKRLALAIIIAVAAIIVTISAQGQGHNVPTGLEGTWRVTVVQEHGPAASAFHTFLVGGAMMESNTLGPTVAHGVWERKGPHTFAHTLERFVFDPTVPFRKAKIREIIEVDGSFQSYTGRGEVLLFDGNGNLVAKDCARTHATRMTVEAPACK